MGSSCIRKTTVKKCWWNVKCKTAKPIEHTKNHAGGYDTRSFSYVKAIGSLLYLSNKTIPNLAFSVNYESRSTENPTAQRMSREPCTLSKWHLRENTKKAGIFYPRWSSYQDKYKIQTYCDADYAGDVKDSRSTSGYC